MNRRQFFGTLTAGLAWIGLGPKVEAKSARRYLGKIRSVPNPEIEYRHLAKWKAGLSVRYEHARWYRG